MTYAEIADLLEIAEKQNAVAVTVDLDMGATTFTLAEALEAWEWLCPGEPFKILAIHWRHVGDGITCSCCNRPVIITI